MALRGYAGSMFAINPNLPVDALREAFLRDSRVQVRDVLTDDCAQALARPGDAVLLSPACSSFDMFRDYKDRGDAFVRVVRALEAQAEVPS